MKTTKPLMLRTATLAVAVLLVSGSALLAVQTIIPDVLGLDTDTGFPVPNVTSSGMTSATYTSQDPSAVTLVYVSCKSTTAVAHYAGLATNKSDPNRALFFRNDPNVNNRCTQAVSDLLDQVCTGLTASPKTSVAFYGAGSGHLNSQANILALVTIED